MEDNMKIDLVLGAKYRVVKGDYSVVGILTNVELDRPHRDNGVFAYSYVDIAADVDMWEDPYSARIYGPWDLIELEVG